MTPTLDRFFHQWRVYKNALVAFLAINVFSVALSFFLAFYYFGSQRDLSSQQIQTLQTLKNADSALSHIQNMLLRLEAKKTWQLRTRQDEIEALDMLSQWNDLKMQLAGLGVEWNSQNFIGFIATPEVRDQLKSLASSVGDKKSNALTDMQKQLTRFQSLTRVLIYTGLATLLFGLILPQFVLYKMGRTLNAIRLEMQHAAHEFIKTWAETKAGFGDEAFKNVDFWLQILLLTTQQASRMSAHPALQVTSELAYLVRQELKKSSDKKVA